MTAILQSEVVQRIRYHLGDMPWETTGSAASSSSVVAVTDGTDWAEGNIGEFLNNGENFYVQSKATNDLTAVRCYYGSTAATQASGRIIKDPRFRYAEITNAISTIIQGFLPWPRVYKLVTTTIDPGWGSGWGSNWGGGTFDDTGPWWDLAVDALGLVAVYQLTDSDPPIRRSYGGHHSYKRVVFERNLPTSLATSTAGLAFPDGFVDPDNVVYVTYAAKFTDTIATSAYSDFTDGEAITEAVILGSVAHLQQALELRKPKKALNETNRLNAGAYYNQLFHSALASAEKEIRAAAPLMQVVKRIA